MRHSAGLLAFRERADVVEVLIGHLGGPLWASKEIGAWSIPKGELETGEDPLTAARREFSEEIGLPAPAGEPLPLGEHRQSSSKLVTAFAVRVGVDELDLAGFRSNLFELEWPPRSGRIQQFPEFDRAAWMSVADAAVCVVKGQRPLLARLEALLADGLLTDGHGAPGGQEPSAGRSADAAST